MEASNPYILPHLGVVSRYELHIFTASKPRANSNYSRFHSSKDYTCGLSFIQGVKICAKRDVQFYNAIMARSKGCLAVSHASQSDAVVL